MKTKANQVLDTKTLGSDLKRIYSMGIFEIVSYEIVRDGDRNILHITPTLKSWGPTFLKLGLFLGTDFQLVTQFDVVALVEATQLNSLGGEWKTLVKVGTPLAVETRFFQPLTYKGRLFLSPFGGWRQDLSRVFDEEGDALATYQVSRGAVGMELGYDFGTVAELRAGYVRAFGKARRKVGDVIFPELDWDEGGFTARLEVDQLDNVNVPHAGYFGFADYLGNRESLGGTESYDRFSTGALGAQTIGRWTGLLRGEGGTGMGRAIPFYDDFQLGGLFRLSGRPFGQIRGDKYVLALAMLYYRLTATQRRDPQEPIRGRFRGGRQRLRIPGAHDLREPENGGEHLLHCRHAARAVLLRLRTLGQQQQRGVPVPESELLKFRSTGD